jgi:hypothetical protein
MELPQKRTETGKKWSNAYMEGETEVVPFDHFLNLELLTAWKSPGKSRCLPVTVNGVPLS